MLPDWWRPWTSCGNKMKWMTHHTLHTYTVQVSLQAQNKTKPVSNFGSNERHQAITFYLYYYSWTVYTSPAIYIKHWTPIYPYHLKPLMSPGLVKVAMYLSQSPPWWRTQQQKAQSYQHWRLEILIRDKRSVRIWKFVEYCGQYWPFVNCPGHYIRVWLHCYWSRHL